MNKQIIWKKHCDKCKKQHYYTNKPCPTCGVYHTPQPVSEIVAAKHSTHSMQCDACQAYEEHLS